MVPFPGPGQGQGQGQGPLKEENLLTVPKPLPKQLWETTEVGEQDSAMFVFPEYLHVRGHCKIPQWGK